MPELKNAPMFADLSEEDWGHLPLTHRVMAKMPFLHLEMDGCQELRTNHYLVRPPLKPISKLPRDEEA